MSKVVDYGDQLTTCRSDDEAWAFTVKMLGARLPTSKDYADVLAKYRDFGFIKTVEAEYDSLGRMHLHGIIMLRRGFHRKRLCTTGFHLKLESIYDEHGWVDYITKSVGPKNKPHPNNNYMF